MQSSRCASLYNLRSKSFCNQKTLLANVFDLTVLFSKCLYSMKRRTAGSENVEYDAGDAEGFGHHYQTPFSDSFKNVFSEVL